MLSVDGGRFDGTADMDAKEYVGIEWERDPDARLSMEDSLEVVDPELHRRYRAIVGALG